MPTYQVRNSAPPQGVFGTGLVGLGDRYARQDYFGADGQPTTAKLSASGFNSFNSEIGFLPCADSLEPCPIWHNNGPNPITITAAVRNGTVTAPVQFQNGERTITIPARGWAWGSALIRVPQNTLAYVRTHGLVAGGDDWPVTHIRGSNDRAENGADLTDKSVTGTIAASSTYTFGPYQVLHRPDPRKVALVCVGDSIASVDSAGGTGDNSFIRVACAGQHSFLHASQGSSTLADILTDGLPYPGSVAVMAPAGNRILVESGNNDVYSNGVDLATFQARATAVYTYLSQFAPVWQSTITPANEGTSFPVHAQANDWIRDGGGGLLAGVVEIADAVETARNSGLWVNGYASGDNRHPSTQGIAAMSAATAASGIFDS